ncbi:Low density lipoprotein receptor adapter protein 1-B [Dirofilaria immitis]
MVLVGSDGWILDRWTCSQRNERKRNDLDDVIGLLRLRLMDAVYDEVNCCGETVAKILDGVLPENERSLVVASVDNSMEDGLGSLDQSDDYDYVTDPGAAIAIKQSEEVLAQTDWESRRRNPPEFPRESELNREEFEYSKGMANKENMELVIQKLLMEAAKVVIKMLEREEINESSDCDDKTFQHD